MTDFKTHRRSEFQIPEEAVKQILEWQQTLIPTPGVGWMSRYRYTFVDNGMVDEIKVKDVFSGSEFSWMPPSHFW